MADISKLTMPSGTTYNIKDATAREAIANLQNTENILSTNAATTPYGVKWMDGSTEITGTLVASATTIKKIYLVPALSPSSQDQNVYDEYLTLKISDAYSWEKIGSTKIDLSGLGDLAWKDSASATYTPAGTVSKPTFTGTAVTPSGTVSQPTFTGTSFTPSGTVSQPSFTGNAVTPSGTVSAPTISVKTAGATASVTQISSLGTLPVLTMTVSSENLSFTWQSGALPSFGTPITVKTGDAAYQATAPTFSGSSFTPSGAVSKPTFTGTAVTPSGTVSQPTFTGTSFTPSGTVSQPSFTGTAATITVT